MVTKNSVSKLMLKPLGSGQTLEMEKERNRRPIARMPIRGISRYNWDGSECVKG